MKGLTPLSQTVRLGMQEINNLKIKIEEINEERQSLQGRLDDLKAIERSIEKKIYKIVCEMDKEATKEAMN